MLHYTISYTHYSSSQIVIIRHLDMFRTEYLTVDPLRIDKSGRMKVRVALYGSALRAVTTNAGANY